jgi:hypothetical protein
MGSVACEIGSFAALSPKSENQLLFFLSARWLPAPLPFRAALVVVFFASSTS